jgi:hypothetical protein
VRPTTTRLPCCLRQRRLHLPDGLHRARNCRPQLPLHASTWWKRQPRLEPAACQQGSCKTNAPICRGQLGVGCGSRQLQEERPALCQPLGDDSHLLGQHRTSILCWLPSREDVVNDQLWLVSSHFTTEGKEADMNFFTSHERNFAYMVLLGICI